MIYRDYTSTLTLPPPNSERKIWIITGLSLDELK